MKGRTLSTTVGEYKKANKNKGQTNIILFTDGFDMYDH